ncbi:ATP-binding protein [Pseudonocardia sp. HH130630-07]|uniref:ATP-binding protein n=1 Tax=Pseudonocardia sp. HH130630-07 TaxID=1690815 RepID=UPI001E4BFF21|nr:sensor histidine kinase [Pseudonocardia sp. HH130630-07]
MLIDNAIRHTGRGTTVDVRWSPGPGRTVVVTVADDGPGLAVADRPRARQRFWQGGSPGAGGSSGLGLAIADRLVTARGGRLDLGPSPAGGLLVTLVLERTR